MTEGACSSVAVALIKAFRGVAATAAEEDCRPSGTGLDTGVVSLSICMPPLEEGAGGALSNDKLDTDLDMACGC